MREPTCLECREWVFSDSAARPFLTPLGTLFLSVSRRDKTGPNGGRVHVNNPGWKNLEHRLPSRITLPARGAMTTAAALHLLHSS